MLGPRTRRAGSFSWTDSGLRLVLFYAVALALKNLITVNAWIFEPPPSSNLPGSFPHQKWQSTRFSKLATPRADFQVCSLCSLKVNYCPQRHSYLVIHAGTAAASSSLSEEESSSSSSSKAPSRLLRLLRPAEMCNVDRMSGTDLAYVGDVVYELFVRSRTVWPPKRTADLQQQAVALVRAEHQSKLLSKLKEEFSLTDKEQQVLNRGRNAGSGRNNNRRDPAAYQDSTAFEAVLGYLYIASPDRCGELLHWIDENVDNV